MGTSVVEIPSSSKEWLNVGVYSSVDPSGFVVEIACTETIEDPTETDWTTAAWKPGKEILFIGGVWRSSWTARILVSGTDGGGAIELVEGVWWVWVRFTDAAQKIVRRAQKIKVT